MSLNFATSTSLGKGGWGGGVVGRKQNAHNAHGRFVISSMFSVVVVVVGGGGGRRGRFQYSARDVSPLSSGWCSVPINGLCRSLCLLKNVALWLLFLMMMMMVMFLSGNQYDRSGMLTWILFFFYL